MQLRMHAKGFHGSLEHQKQQKQQHQVAPRVALARGDDLGHGKLGKSGNAKGFHGSLEHQKQEKQQQQVAPRADLARGGDLGHGS
jgi:hypothetical protein